MKYNYKYSTTRSKWYLCFCCLWSRCCNPPQDGDDQQLLEEYTYLQENTGKFFNATNWEQLYPVVRNFRLVKDAEREAGIVYRAFAAGSLDALYTEVPDLDQLLKFWRWLNSDRTKSLLHHQF